MKKNWVYLASVAVAGGAILGLAATSAVSAAPRAATSVAAASGHGDGRIAVNDIQLKLDGECWGAYENGEITWGVPSVYPPGSKVVATAVNSPHEVTREALFSSGKMQLPVWRKEMMNYHVKVVTPTGTESQISTVSMGRASYCMTGMAINGSRVDNVDYAEADAVISISKNPETGKGEVLFNEEDFLSGNYRYIFEVNGKYVGDVKGGRAAYLPVRNGDEGTRVFELKDLPAGNVNVQVFIDNTTIGEGKSSQAQVIASKVL